MGMLDFWRDPKAEEDPALPEPRGDGDAPCWSLPFDLADLANSSFRNCSLFILKMVRGWLMRTRRLLDKSLRSSRSTGPKVRGAGSLDP